jgi:Rrf2 family transcriptional regulator, cysteine metabolism repressor
MLARRAESITVGDVLHFVEGRQEERARLRKQADSPFSDLWERADLAIDSILESTTFAQLVREWTEKHSRFVPNWEI